MKVLIAAVGRLKPGPERSLTDDYLARAAPLGRRIGIAPFEIVEVDERKARDAPAQSARLLEATPADAHAVALDERGEALSSAAFAAMLAGLRDRGTPVAAFLIGGADGHDAGLRARADRLISFGPMVWPHLLARAMLAEQLYRAVSILAGTPYHRG